MTPGDGFGLRGSEMMLVSSRYFTIHNRTGAPRCFRACPREQFVGVDCKLCEVSLIGEVPVRRDEAAAV